MRIITSMTFISAYLFFLGFAVSGLCTKRARSERAFGPGALEGRAFRQRKHYRVASVGIATGRGSDIAWRSALSTFCTKACISEPHIEGGA
jgi:hypothetical protein